MYRSCLFNVYNSLISLELDVEEFNCGLCRLHVFVWVNNMFEFPVKAH